VKQSIYRWRGGRLELLLNEVQSQIREDLIEVENLAVNYRSLPGIIGFNNTLFEKLPALLQIGMQDYFQVDAENLLTDAFSGVTQEIPEKKKGLEFQGKIHLEFTEKSNSKNSSEEEDSEEEGTDATVLDKLPALVMQLQDQGYELRDIAFLVRKNAQGAEIADHLMEYQSTNPDSGYRFDVLSEESLFIDKSIAVKCLLAFFSYLNNPSDKVAMKTIWHYYALLQEVELSHSLFYKHSLPEELKQKEQQLLSLENTLLQLPLVELMEEGLSFLGLTEKQQDLAYVSGFKEAVFDFVKKNRADLSGFLDWWELNKGKRTVKIPEDHDAMRILTIHKSKGLQYKVVIMPFMDWEIVAKGQQAPIIWAPYPMENPSTVVPLTHQSLLKNSNFAPFYEDEVRLAYLDSLNMLYVAFTRAEEVIWGFSDFTKSKDGVKLNRTGNVLFTLFSNGFQLPIPSGEGWNTETLTFDWGEWGRKIPPKAEKPKAPLGLRWEILDWKEKLKTRNYAWDFSEEGIQARNQRKLGVIIHELLAESQSLEDALRLLREFTFEGRWDETTAEEVKTQLEMLFALNQIQDWFSPVYQSLSEQGILLPGGAQKRPDRILIGKEKALVIDFKTGEKRETHLQQVKDYMGLVAKLSQLPVKGYLCYLEPTEILEV
jgi:ATP-dependent exoDNAse (exonuclease V) beta subunit